VAEGVPARLTPGDLRRFALTVGAALAGLGGLSWRRGHLVVGPGLAGLGAALGLCGLLAPARLGPVYRGWMRFGRLLSALTTPLVLGLVYFGVITPIGVLMRLAGRNPLRHRAGAMGYWKRRQPSPADPADTLQRQF
jgi:hypothetical protein